MTRAHRPVALAALVLVLAATACGGEQPADDPPRSSSSRTSGTSTTGTSTSPEASSPDGSEPVTRTSSSGSSSPDPEVEVTPGTDGPQSAAEREAGTRAADGQATASSLSIPAVGLETTIGPQGLRDGKVNPDADEVIWFTGHDRARPGATGTTVIAGHVVNPQGPDEFAALEQLETGDGVVLGYPGGQQLRFEVTKTDIVGKDALTRNRDVWGENTDSRRVVLVTCDDELGFREDGHRKANFVAVAELPS